MYWNFTFFAYFFWTSYALSAVDSVINWFTLFSNETRSKKIGREISSDNDFSFCTILIEPDAPTGICLFKVNNGNTKTVWDLFKVNNKENQTDDADVVVVPI